MQTFCTFIINIHNSFLNFLTYFSPSYLTELKQCHNHFDVLTSFCCSVSIRFIWKYNRGKVTLSTLYHMHIYTSKHAGHSIFWCFYFIRNASNLKKDNIQYTPIINAYIIWFVAFQKHLLSCGTTIKSAQCFCPSRGQLDWILMKFATEEFNNHKWTT